jgi:hypothetical protein
MQELMTYTGQLDCYQACNEILSKFLNVEVSVMQVHRVTDTYGGLLEQQATAARPPSETAVTVRPQEASYAMIDGSMILTREQGWQEVKLGRIFSQSDCMELSTQRGWIKHSSYEAYLGSSKTFTRRIEQQLDPYSCLKEQLIFITDGAIWIKNWIADAYPAATQILDWYHACEHLCEFAGQYFEDPEVKQAWIERQKELLYESRTEEVINNLGALAVKKKSDQQAKDSLLQYYQTNKDRMDYKKYRTMGAGLIGSGAIESAHRTVVQKRMKQSGQRWTRNRAQNMLTLRCIRLSGQWHKVINLICSHPKAA